MKGRVRGVPEKGVPETEGLPEPESVSDAVQEPNPVPDPASESQSLGVGDTPRPGVPGVERGAGGPWKFCEGESMSMLEEWR